MNNNSQIIELLQNPDLELITIIYITPIVAAGVMLILIHPTVDECLKEMIPVPIQRFIAKILILFIAVYAANIIIYRSIKNI